MHSNRHAAVRRRSSIAVALGLLVSIATTSRAQGPGGNSFAETLLKAEAAGAAQHWPEAAALWQQVIQVNPVIARFYFQLATALYGAKEYRKAIPAFEKAMELRAGFPANMAYNVAC